MKHPSVSSFHYSCICISVLHIINLSILSYFYFLCYIILVASLCSSFIFSLPSQHIHSWQMAAPPHTLFHWRFLLLKVRSSSPPSPSVCAQGTVISGVLLFFEGPFWQYKVHSSIQNQTELNWMCYHANENSHHWLIRHIIRGYEEKLPSFLAEKLNGMSVLYIGCGQIHELSLLH